MKTIGIVGGMSWVSTHAYYKILNELVMERLGPTHSCVLILQTIDFDVYHSAMMLDDFTSAAAAIIPAALNLERAGADFVMLASNTPHLFAPKIEAALGVPLLHIARATGAAIAKKGLKKVGLLGTKFTMEKPFYREILSDDFGLEVAIPNDEDRALVHHIIIEELARNIFSDTSRKAYLDIIQRFAAAGCEAVIFGCTEIGLLIDPAESPILAFDTAQVHCEAAVALALAD